MSKQIYRLEPCGTTLTLDHSSIMPITDSWADNGDSDCLDSAAGHVRTVSEGLICETNNTPIVSLWKATWDGAVKSGAATCHACTKSISDQTWTLVDE